MERVLFIAVIVFGLGFAFVNGFHDGCNVIATIVSSRSMEPGKALFFASLAEFIGPLILGTAVASTVGTDILNPKCLDPACHITPALVLFSALLSSISWDLITWRWAIPSSSSHALVGGLVGGGIASFGFSVVQWQNLFLKVILVLFGSPIIGMVVGYLAMKLSIILFRNAHPRINNVFKRLQFFSMIFLGASHGANDAQKSMGVITLMLVTSGFLRDFKVPTWVIIGCAGSLAIGVSMGGWKIIKTVGTKIFRVEPIHSFNAQVASGAVIFAAGIIGGPVSTTQIMGSTIMGVGTGYRAREVRWLVVKDILFAWIITIPVSAVIAAVFYLITSIASGMGTGNLGYILKILG